jgi:predicted flap endonuclease-1-like 5' DNA nuclease
VPKLENIEGIGQAYGAKLRKGGVGSITSLLSQGKTPAGRKEIAKKTGLSPKLILTWINHADLKRIRGVERQYSELLEAAGVDTVVELAQRRADNLLEKMMDVNKKKKILRRPPTLSMVEDWIKQAKKLPRAVHY